MITLQGANGIIQRVEMYTSRRSDQPALGTNTQLIGHINEAQRYIHRNLAASNRDFMLVQTTIALTPGTTDYALPADFYSLRFLSDGTDPINFERLDLYQINASDGRSSASVYQGAGGWRLLFHTLPSASSATLWYQRSPSDLHYGTTNTLTATGATFDTPTAGTVNPTPNHYLNSDVFVFSGTGIGQLRQIASSTSAGVFTVGTAWSPTPTADSVMEVVSSLPDIAIDAVVYMTARLWRMSRGLDTADVDKMLALAIEASTGDVKGRNRQEQFEIKIPVSRRPDQSRRGFVIRSNR